MFFRSGLFGKILVRSLLESELWWLRSFLAIVILGPAITLSEFENLIAAARK